MKKILTIIIPCYNCEQTIRNTLNSIPEVKDIEIILVDDGSTDKTKKIIDDYLCNPNIKYIYQNNAGPGSARNKGISMATGNYIMFLDSDDTINTKNLKELIEECLILNKYDVIYYNFEQVLPNGKIYQIYSLEKFNKMDNEELIKHTISWNLPWGQFKIIRNNIIKENNICFEEKVKNSEELFFTIEVLKNSNQIFFYNKVIYRYLKRENSLSTKIDLETANQTAGYIFGQLKEKSKNTTYEKVIYNYIVVSELGWLKQTATTKQYKIFCQICKNIRKNINNIESNYINKKYQMILKIIPFHLDFLLYLAFKIYFRGK